MVTTWRPVFGDWPKEIGSSYRLSDRKERSRLGRVAKSKQGVYRGGQLTFGYKSVDKKHIASLIETAVKSLV